MISIYRCVDCGHTPLARSVTALSCTSCGSRFPLVFNVPVFVPRLRCKPSGFRLGGDTAAALSELVGMPSSMVSHYILEQIHSYDYQWGETVVQAKENGLLQVVGKRPLTYARDSERARLHDYTVVSEINARRRPGLRILEVGRNTLASVFPDETYCVDTDLHALQIRQWAQKSNDEDTPFTLADVRALPFVERAFDVVVCTPASVDAIAPLQKDLLKPDGILRVTGTSAMAGAA